MWFRTACLPLETRQTSTFGIIQQSLTCSAPSSISPASYTTEHETPVSYIIIALMRIALIPPLSRGISTLKTGILFLDC
jgi:hypothetical protein